MSEETRRIERECLGGRVRMLNRRISAIYDEQFSELGLKVSQFSVLVAVTNRGAARPAELAKILEMDESTLSRNVERMCAKGWLRLEGDDDRRSHFIKITDKGLALVRKGYAAWQRAQSEAVNQLGEPVVGALRSAIRTLRS